MARDRLANLLIDTTDLVVGAETPEDGWNVINTVGSRIGAHAVNALGIEPGHLGPVWGWSSMDPDWIDEYFTVGLVERDPLFHAASIGDVPALLTKDAVLRPGEPDLRDRQFHDGLDRHDYNYFCCHAWSDGPGPVRKLIVMSSDRDPTGLFGPGTERAFRSVSAMLSTVLAPPEDLSLHRNGIAYHPLSRHERDALAYLANGLSEADIAQRLGLSKFDLMRIQRTASRKMGAATREQTLALAMARGLIDL